MSTLGFLPGASSLTLITGPGVIFDPGGTQRVIIFEPTCAYCTVGSYASLSVCLSVCHVTKIYWIKIHISKSIVAVTGRAH